jgi:hypothetical protein
MRQRFAHNTGILPAMTGYAIAGQAGVVHSPAQESIGIGVAGLTGQQRRKVVCRFAYNSTRLTIVAEQTLTRYSDMFKACDQEAGRALMAGVTSTGCLNMVDRFRGCSDAGSGSVAASTVFRSVFEDAIHVALLAPQGGMYISQQEPGLRVVERRVAECRFRLNER